MRPWKFSPGEGSNGDGRRGRGDARCIKGKRNSWSGVFNQRCTAALLRETLGHLRHPPVTPFLSIFHRLTHRKSAAVLTHSQAARPGFVSSLQSTYRSLTSFSYLSLALAAMEAVDATQREYKGSDGMPLPPCQISKKLTQCFPRPSAVASHCRIRYKPSCLGLSLLVAAPLKSYRKSPGLHKCSPCDELGQPSRCDCKPLSENGMAVSYAEPTKGKKKTG